MEVDFPSRPRRDSFGRCRWHNRVYESIFEFIGLTDYPSDRGFSKRPHLPSPYHFLNHGLIGFGSRLTPIYDESLRGSEEPSH